jgi:hypothetical protein
MKNRAQGRNSLEVLFIAKKRFLRCVCKKRFYGWREKSSEKGGAYSRRVNNRRIFQQVRNVSAPEPIVETVRALPLLVSDAGWLSVCNPGPHRHPI